MPTGNYDGAVNTDVILMSSEVIRCSWTDVRGSSLAALLTLNWTLH